ncbi:ribose-5-phosphate isomerase RpiA [Phenylobacterium sp.]|uniref:ribose-5-phosphate isomerase RpiA n=1 Tax=Phenylobacterium sp. TaxID=1871053 RepID=UPI0039C9D138
MVVGLGTGSTAVWFVKALAGRGLDVICVSTSVATADLARDLGLKLADLGEVREIDLTVDGADEIGPGLSLIKGAGGALLREKLVWEASRRCVTIADAAKRVPVLGQFPLSVEVVAFGHQSTSLRICDALTECDIGAAPRLRARDGATFHTDSGNVIYDIACGRIEDPAALASALKSVTGVVEHGLFLDLADLALIGTPDGVVSLEP